MGKALEKFLSPTAIIDSDHPRIVDFARDVTRDSDQDPVEKAVKLYYAVRDAIRYDPYSPFYLPEHYRASNVLRWRRGYCVSKAALLCALGRACGIASRIGFATVSNHLASRKLIEFLGTNRFVYHGYVEFYLENRWVKATPAFNAQLCERHGVEPLDFNGHEDAIFQSYNRENKKFMEYLDYHGTHADIPVDEIVAAWEQAYGRRRVKEWIRNFEVSGWNTDRDFYSEKPLSKS
jgi:transglutaminase-like putative cysteine protease